MKCKVVEKTGCFYHLVTFFKKERFLINFIFFDIISEIDRILHIITKIFVIINM